VPAGGGGTWVPTPPANAPALLPHWGGLPPFALRSGSQFRPGPPAAIDSARHRDELREVRELGAASSRQRSPAQTDAARFWVASAVQLWNPAARQASAAKGQGITDRARALAMLNVAIADALIACFDAKFTYNGWRPITAIRAGADGAAPVADWLPLIVTPPFPGYPSAHACAAGAAQDVLERIFGPAGHAIVLASPTAPGVSFRYASFAGIADQVDEARIHGGIHVRQDQEVGRAIGRSVGQYVYETLAR
jgi:hypothetical protein